MPERIELDMFVPCGMNYLVCYKHCYSKGHGYSARIVTKESWSIARSAGLRIVGQSGTSGTPKKI